MSKPMIEIKQLSVAFNGQTVLNDLNFSVGEGEIVAVVGPNGSGKTTLVRAILGLVPYRGRILIAGKSNRETLKRSPPGALVEPLFLVSYWPWMMTSDVRNRRTCS